MDRSNNCYRQEITFKSLRKKSPLPPLNVVDLYSTERHGKFLFRGKWREFVDGICYDDYIDEEEDYSYEEDEYQDNGRSDLNEENDSSDVDADASHYETDGQEDTDLVEKEVGIDEEDTDTDEKDTGHNRQEAIIDHDESYVDKKDTGEDIDFDEIYGNNDEGSALNHHGKQYPVDALQNYIVQTEYETYIDDDEDDDEELGELFGIYTESQMFLEFKSETIMNPIKKSVKRNYRKRNAYTKDIVDEVLHYLSIII